MKLLKRIFVFLSLLLFTFYLLPIKARAEGEFKTDINVYYKVQTNGVTLVNYNMSLQNLFTDLYATSYSLILSNIKPEDIKAYENNEELITDIEKLDDKTTIKVTFKNALVGKGKSREFNIVYEDSEIASRTGEVWEVAIPRLSQNNSFNFYSLSLSIPLSFGQEAYLSPNPMRREQIAGERFYYFDKDAVAKTGITAGFGEFQVFTFNLIYHLENPLAKGASIDIAVPPDTSLQKIYYENFSPRPETVHLDEDGNWLATYLLKPRERIDATVHGYVQIFSGPRPFPQSSQSVLVENLKSTDYWQTTDPQIIGLARELKTPREIYNYVSNRLSYNFDRAKPNVVRIGAVEALKEPKNAICMEYTDLFIAIARAAGIPAREINGFAYTENPKIQPLSLVSDVLHSWPEYWDSAKKTWVSIDPTWGSTTGGIDFFNKLDLRHFAFVIHGKDPQKPYPPGSYKLGPNPQKDVFVSFGQLLEKRVPELEISYKVSKFIPFSSQKINVFINNSGVTAFYNLPVNILFDEKTIDTRNIEVLPPFANYSFEISIPFSFLGAKTPNNVTVLASDEKVDIPTSKNQVIIYNLASIFLASIILLVIILIKLGKIRLQKLAFYRSLIHTKKQI